MILPRNAAVIYLVFLTRSLMYIFIFLNIFHFTVDDARLGYDKIIQ